MTHSRLAVHRQLTAHSLYLQARRNLPTRALKFWMLGGSQEWGSFIYNIIISDVLTALLRVMGDVLVSCRFHSARQIYIIFFFQREKCGVSVWTCWNACVSHLLCETWEPCRQLSAPHDSGIIIPDSWFTGSLQLSHSRIHFEGRSFILYIIILF